MANNITIPTHTRSLSYCILDRLLPLHEAAAEIWGGQNHHGGRHPWWCVLNKVWVSVRFYEHIREIQVHQKKKGGGGTQSIHPCPSSTVCMCNRWKRSLVRFYQRKGAFPKWELDWNSSRRNVVNLCCWEFASGRCHGVVQESGNGQTAYITMTRVMWPTLIIWQLCGEKNVLKENHHNIRDENWL